MGSAQGLHASGSSDQGEFENLDMGSQRGEIFSVHFGQSGRLDTSEIADALGLVGPGTLEVHDGKVFLTALRHRSFRPSRSEQHAIALSDTFNVQCAGNEVRFECRLADGRQGHVALKTVDVASAARIAVLLPKTRTRAFAIDQVDRARFRDRLDRLGPRARVTPALVAINLFVFALMVFDGVGLFVVHPDVAIKWGSNFAPLTMQGEWWRLFTAMFIHFGILHVALNMWALYLSGATTERLYGSFRFLVVYVFAGLTGGLVSLLWNSAINTAGASGAIFGVFGAMLAFVINPRNGVPRSIMTEHRNSTLAFAAYTLIYGVLHGGIDNAAHIGGLVGGFLMGLMLARPLRENRRAAWDVFRLFAAVCTGMLALALLLHPLLNPTEAVRNRQAFDRGLLAFASKEQRAVLAMRNAQSLAASDNREAMPGFARIMESDAYPQWNALYEEMAAPKLVAADPRAKEQALVIRYLDDRRRYCQLIAEAALRQDAALGKQAQAANQDAEGVFQKLQQLDAERGR